MLIWDVERSFQIWGQPVRWYGLFFVLGLLCVWRLGASAYTRRNMPATYLPQLIMVFCVGIVLGGHLFHMVFYEPRALVENPLRILEVGRGMASHGSFLGILIALKLWTKWSKASFLRVCDASAVAWFWLFPFVRIGNFFNSEILGTPTELPWGVVFVHSVNGGDLPRHPVQLYHAAFNAGMVALARITDTNMEQFKPGVRAALLIGFYCVGRFLIEFFKAFQSLPEGSPLNMGQIWSLIGVLVCGTVAFTLQKRSTNSSI